MVEDLAGLGALGALAAPLVSALGLMDMSERGGNLGTHDLKM